MILSQMVDRQIVQKKISDVKFVEKFDVAIAGLGTAGAISAISAAENGANVIGFDRAPLCGGTGTGGGIIGYYFGMPGGRFEAIDQEALRLQEKAFVEGSQYYHPDTKISILENLLTETACSIYYETVLSGVYLDDDESTIVGVKLLTIDGVLNIGCTMLIDSTGDGEVGAIAGANYILGRNVDEQPQPYSSVRVFHDDNKLGIANFDAGYVRPDSAKDMSQAIISSNSLHLPELDEKRVLNLWFSVIPGLREGRLLECEERLKFDDFINGKRFAEPVALCFSNFDSHSQDWAFESDAIKEWMVCGSLWGYNMVIPIPLETMIVKGFSNLLCAGRCIGIDHDMACAVRMMRGMQKIGEAAGISAALAAKDNINIRDVNRDDLTKKLSCSGALNRIWNDDPMPEDDLMCGQLASEKAGFAIWKISRNIEKYKTSVIKLLLNNNKHVRYNAAIALGLGGCKSSVPVLFDMIATPDNFSPLTSRSHNQRRVLAAIYLLGKLQVFEAIDPLFILMQKNIRDEQIVSHAAMSLLKLGEDNISVRKKIVARFEIHLKDIKLDLPLKAGATSQRCCESLENLLSLIVAKEINSWRITTLLEQVKPQTMREKRLHRKIISHINSKNICTELICA